LKQAGLAAIIPGEHELGGIHGKPHPGVRGLQKGFSTEHPVSPLGMEQTKSAHILGAHADPQYPKGKPGGD
jgi:hypothetical protein